MIRAIIVIGSFFLLVGCSQTEDTEPLPDEVRELDNVTVYSSDSEPEYDLQLSKEQTFPRSEEVLIDKILGVETDDRGNIYIAGGQRIIHVFNSDGRQEDQIGRTGRGPGEFGGLVMGNTFQIDGSRLYVYDPRYRRINIFSTETFEYITRISLLKSRASHMDELKISSPILHTVVSEELFVVKYADFSRVVEYPESVGDTYARYYFVNSKGEITGGKIFEIPLPLPPVGADDVLREILVAVSADKEHLYTAWNEHFLVKIRDLNGNYLRGFYYPYENVEMEPDDIPSIKAEVEMPNTWPALSDILIDDQNRLWISTIVEDDDIYKWWVLEDTGELLARFEWPRDKEIEVIKNGKLYTLETDEETGLEEVVRYRIEMKD